MLEGIWQYSDGDDIFRIVETFQLSWLDDNSEHIMEKVASYPPVAIVNMVLNMIKVSHMVTHTAHHNISYKFEFHNTHDKNGKYNNEYNDQLALRFQHFFGQSPRG